MVASTTENNKIIKRRMVSATVGTEVIKMVVKKGSHFNKDLKEEVKQQVMGISGRRAFQEGARACAKTLWRKYAWHV